MIVDAGQNVKKEEHSSIDDKIESWYKHFGNQSNCSSELLKIVLAEDPAIPLLGIYPKMFQYIMCSATFIAASFIIARSLKQPRWS